MGKLGTITRRTLLVGSAAIGGGVLFGVYQYKKPLPNPLKEDLAEGEAALTPYVKIDQSGVTLVTPRADIGQGAYSVQVHLIAEELDVDPTKVKYTPGKPSKAYYNGAVMDEGAPGLGDIIGRLMGLQITGGSSTLPDMFIRLRHAGAVARETLKKAASMKFGVSVSELTTQSGYVVLPDQRKVEYKELAELAAEIEIDQDIKLREKSEWKYIGKPQQRLDIMPKSTGTQEYGIDLVKENMVYASVRANPGMGGDVLSYNDAKAKQIRGVQKVLPISHGIAVIADNSWRAFKGLEALEITWGPAPYPATSQEMWKILENHIDSEFKNVSRLKKGDVDEVLSQNDVLEAEYRTPYLAHAPLEPMNATVLCTDERIDIWTGTQIPRFIENHVATLTGLDKKNIHLHVLVSGGSFGRRLEDVYVLQAVEIASQIKGTPVKMTWSREEDMTHDFPRPMTIAKGRGCVDDGKVIGFDLDIVSASLIASQMGRVGAVPPGPDATITTGADDQPYGIENYRVTGYKAPEMVPISSWRSVGASQNGFYHEMLLEELINKANADPLKERIRLCSDPVAKSVMEELGRFCDWQGAKPSDGRGRGIAFVKSFGVPVAMAVDVVDSEHGIKIDKVFVVADVALVVDPINIEAQLFGGAIWGLGHAMNCELTYENYAPEQTNYHAYEGMRMYQTPDIFIRVLENGDAIKGAGEPAVPPCAPALTNAIFALTGKRIRELPLNKNITFA